MGRDFLRPNTTLSDEYSLFILNISGNVTDHIRLYTLPDFIASIVIVVINALGVVSNCIMLAAVVNYPLLRQSSSFLLIVHCVFVEIVNSCVIPVNSFIYLLGPSFKLPTHFCVAYAFFGLVPSGVGLYANCALAIQRLIAVLLPHHFRRFATLTATRCFLALPWLLSLLIHSFLATGVLGFFMMQSDDHPPDHCLIRSTDKGGIALTTYVFTQMHLPLGTIGISYTVLLVKTVVSLRKETKKPNNAARIDMQRRRLDISRGLFISFLWHIVGTYQLIFTSGVSPRNTVPVIIQVILRVLAASYSALNPVFLFASSKIFRNGVKSVLGIRTSSARNTVRPSGAPSNFAHTMMNTIPS